jgi:hypothetical protein
MKWLSNIHDAEQADARITEKMEALLWLGRLDQNSGKPDFHPKPIEPRLQESVVRLAMEEFKKSRQQSEPPNQGEA